MPLENAKLIQIGGRTKQKPIFWELQVVIGVSEGLSSLILHSSIHYGEIKKTGKSLAPSCSLP